MDTKKSRRKYLIIVATITFVIALNKANKTMLDTVIEQGLEKSVEEVVNQLLSEEEIEVQKEIPKTKIVLGKKVKTRIIQKRPNYVLGG